jgi:signal transduction histidine kinase
LRFKVAAGVLLLLLAILSILNYARHITYQELLLGNLHSAAKNAGEVIAYSVQHAMLTNDFSTLGHIVDDIGKQPDVQAIYLLSKPGEVILSTQDEAIGKVLDIKEPTCQACHQYEAISRNENVVLDFDGNKVFRNVIAIENAAECFDCHGDSVSTLGILITDFDVAPMERLLAVDRRNSILWLVGSVSMVVVAVYLLMDRMVIARIRKLVEAVERVGKGKLDVQVPARTRDEIGELARAFDQMVDGLRERDRLESSLRDHAQELQAHTRRLAILNALADALSQSLDLRETLDNALDRVLELMDLRASWVVLTRDQDEGFELAASRGLPKEAALSHMACTWNRCVCAEIMESGQVKVLDDLSADICPTSAYLCSQGLVSRACVPLKAKDRVLGVMSLLGDASSNGLALEDHTQDTLLAIGHQIGIAIENARLYQELQREETLRRHLLERVMAVQEEERKRIALELHDQTGQPLTSLIITLGVLSETTSLTEAKAHVPELRALASRIFQDVHDLALELRPSVLDDLGLLAALRHLHKEYQDRFRLPVDLQVLGLDGERLPSEVETALYRIVQEALTNVARHADAHSVSVLLERRGASLKLIVEDDGQGFDVASMMSSHSRDRLGLYGMRERASLLGGTLTIESSLDMGTAVYVEIPLGDTKGNGQDSPVDR